MKLVLVRGELIKHPLVLTASYGLGSKCLCRPKEHIYRIYDEKRIQVNPLFSIPGVMGTQVKSSGFLRTRISYRCIRTSGMVSVVCPSQQQAEGPIIYWVPCTVGLCGRAAIIPAILCIHPHTPTFSNNLLLLSTPHTHSALSHATTWRALHLKNGDTGIIGRSVGGPRRGDPCSSRIHGSITENWPRRSIEMMMI